jgi:hypothetical protein
MAMSTTRHHAEWLSLVEQSGLFLSMSVLLKSFLAGLEAHDPERIRALWMGDEERQQLERNMNALRERVRQALQQIKRETVSIRARFANPQPRMFPVAVTFLMPERLALSLSAVRESR